MIVVDVWVVPRLWRSELRNILATYLRLNQMDLADAALIFQRATELVRAEEYEMVITLRCQGLP
jgi:hypothetical protein